MKNRLPFFAMCGAVAAVFVSVSSTAGAAPPANDVPPIRLAMSAAFVSESGVDVYEKMTEYLSVKSGIPCEFVTGLSYGTINEMLAAGAVDAAFVCGLPYVIERDKPQPNVTLLVAPVMKDARYGGKPKYFSDLIVKKGSSYQSLADLRGKTYVYNDELSNSGYNMPRHKLVEMGETKGFFGKVLRSGSHEESIRMVAQGEADASFVDSLVLDYDRTKGKGFAAQVHVVESRGPAGICPVVASAKIAADRRQKLQDVFLQMDKDPDGRKLLDEALVARFEKVDDGNYDDIRGMKKQAEDAGFGVIK
jgi:phosphonate transport system substrate-binding protein